MKTTITDALDEIRSLSGEAITGRSLKDLRDSLLAVAKIVNHVWPVWEHVNLFTMPRNEALSYLALLEREHKLVAFLKARYPKYLDSDSCPRFFALAKDLGVLNTEAEE